MGTRTAGEIGCTLRPHLGPERTRDQAQTGRLRPSDTAGQGPRWQPRPCLLALNKARTELRSRETRDPRVVCVCACSGKPRLGVMGAGGSAGKPMPRAPCVCPELVSSALTHWALG